METPLVSRALMMAINLRNPPEELLHCSDRGSRYASRAYQALLRLHGMVCSMSRQGNCWDNAPTERSFSSIKREWLTGNVYITREDTVADVRADIAYCNSRRLHTTLVDNTPIEFKQCAWLGVRLGLTTTTRMAGATADAEPDRIACSAFARTLAWHKAAVVLSTRSIRTA